MADDTRLTALADLITRLEKATGPDRELGARLICLQEKSRFLSVEPGPFGLIRVAMEWDDGCRDELIRADPTASLDAALTLVPAGWFLHDIGECVMPVRFNGDRHDPTGWFQAGIQWRDGGGRMTRANGRSLALALCIASLRASIRALPLSPGAQS